MGQFKRLRSTGQNKKHEPLHQQIKRDTQLIVEDDHEILQDLVSCDEDESCQEMVLDQKSCNKILQQSHQQYQQLIKEGIIKEKKKDHSESIQFATCYEEVSLSPEDQAILQQFEQTTEAVPSDKLLADLVMEKLQKFSATQTADSSLSQIHPKVQESFKKIGQLLARYRSGKLPKAFKVIPALKNWQQILFLTEPLSWTPHAVFEGTKIFCSTMSTEKAQVYLEFVLLPHFLNEIQRNKRISVQVYQAIFKSIYKPSAFFKGIVFPLLQSTQQCTLKVAAILASIIGNSSIPALHASAALVHLTKQPGEFSGATGIVLRALLDKKYALAYRVIDHLANYFLSFLSDKRILPVLWHQALLVFCQRYKNDLTKEQRESIVKLVSAKGHYLIGSEVCRELEGSICSRDLSNSS